MSRVSKSTNSEKPVRGRKKVLQEVLEEVQVLQPKVVYVSDDGDDEKTDTNVNNDAAEMNTHHKIATTTEKRPVRQNRQKKQYQTNNSLKFSYDEILQKGETKLSENDTETILKYLIATTHKAGQNVLCKVFKNTLTGMKNETTLPMTTYHKNYTKQPRQV